MTTPVAIRPFQRNREAFTEPLKLADRCDRCGAQAFVVTRHTAGDLMWCAHHYRKHQDELLEEAQAILDDTDLVNVNPSTSANAQ